MTELKTRAPEPSWWWLAVVLGIAFGVRIVGLGSWDVWTDELHTMQIARTGEYSFGPAYKTAPLNFILTAWALRTFGDSVLVARTVPFIAGLLSVPLLVVCFSRWIGRRAALLAGGILALASWHVYWSQNARHFALTTLLVLLGFYGFLAHWKDRKWWGAIVAPVAMLAALFTHSSAGFYLAAMMAFVGLSLLWQLWRGREAGPSVKHHLITLAVLGLTLAIYLPAYLSVGKYLLGNVAPWNPAWNIVGSLVFYIAPALGCFAIAGFAFLIAEQDDSAWLFLASLVVPLLLLTFASNFTTASAAYYLPSVLILAVLAGVAGDRLLAWSGRAVQAPIRLALVAMVTAVFASQLLDLALYHTYYRGLKPRWADAAEYVATHRRPGDVVLASEADVVAYYLGSHDDVVWMDRHSSNLEAPTVPRKAEGGVWYAVYAANGSILSLPESAQRHLESKAQLKRVFQMHYGPKDRSIAVFYEPSRPPVGEAAR